MDQPIQDRVGNSRRGDDVGPGIERDLADDDHGTAVRATLQNLEDIPCRLRLQRIYSPVVDDEEIGLLQPAHKRGIAAVSPPMRGSKQKPTEVANRALETQLSELERRRCRSFRPRWDRLDYVGMAFDELALRKGEHGGFVQPSGWVEVDVFNGGGLPELCDLEPAPEAPCFLEVPLSVDN